MRARPSARVIALAVSAALLTACGSRADLGTTTPGSQTNGLGINGSLDGSTLPTNDPSTGTPTAQPSTSDGTPIAEPTSDGASPSESVTAAPVGGGQANPTKAPGVTASTITVGTYYLDSQETNALVSGIGASNSTGDQRAQQRAIVDYINSHGGVAGRQLQLVQHKLETTADPGVETQAVCSDWTQDHKVFAGLGGLPTNNGLLVQCLAKNKTLSIGGMTSNIGIQADFQRYAPYYYAPASIELVTAGRIYAEGLFKLNYFDKGSKVGVLYIDSPEFQASLKQGLLPALAKGGIKDVTTAGIAYDGSYSDYFGLVSRTQSAVLRFKALGINRVLFIDVGGGMSYWFLNHANGQNYSPRYGFSTLSSTAFLEKSFNSRVLNNSVSVGWIPPQDANSATGLPANPARTQCESIMAKAGLKAISAFDGQFQMALCSVFFFFKEAIDKTKDFSIGEVTKAINSLGATGTPSAAGITDYYAPGKSWGGSAYANLKYESNCSCFRFQKPVIQVR